LKTVFCVPKRLLVALEFHFQKLEFPRLPSLRGLETFDLFSQLLVVHFKTEVAGFEI
jgi:hypothetical protein